MIQLDLDDEDGEKVLRLAPVDAEEIEKMSEQQEVSKKERKFLAVFCAILFLLIGVLVGWAVMLAWEWWTGSGGWEAIEEHTDGKL